MAFTNRGLPRGLGAPDRKSDLSFWVREMGGRLLRIEWAFGDLEDFRRWTPAHDLTEMLVLGLSAILSLSSLFPSLKGLVVAIAGMTIRRSLPRAEWAMHLVSIHSVGLGVALVSTHGREI